MLGGLLPCLGLALPPRAESVGALRKGFVRAVFATHGCTPLDASGEAAGAGEIRAHGIPTTLAANRALYVAVSLGLGCRGEDEKTEDTEEPREGPEAKRGHGIERSAVEHARDGKGEVDGKRERSEIHDRPLV